jgi:hypothetical protein
MSKNKRPEEIPEKIIFKYVFSDDYNPLYVNGVYGGITPNREIVANFFFERHGLPFSQIMDVESDGKLGKEYERHPKEEYPYLVRVVENGVILNLENAKKIHKWLGDKIQELEGLNASITDNTKRK